MRKAKIWRVRVVRKVEDWLDISADTAMLAEIEAAKAPMVLSVFGGSAMRGDRPLDGMTAPLGVIDDEEDQYNG